MRKVKQVSRIHRCGCTYEKSATKLAREARNNAKHLDEDHDYGDNLNQMSISSMNVMIVEHPISNCESNIFSSRLFR